MPHLYDMEPNIEDPTGLLDKPFEELDLLNALDSIRTRARFASTTRIKIDNPDIFVQDVGMIDNPLSEAQAKQIAAKSHQAPRGTSNETIIDTSVPSIWELNPDQFEIREPAWQTYLNKTLVYIARELAITSPISAELHKMLLYEQGAMSKNPIDIEKVPGMFGTLVINLPSRHEGGEVVVKYRNASKIFPNSHYNMACTFWFSDASYEVLPVKSGYNWVLVYKLAMAPTAAVPTAASRFENKALLRMALESWLQEVSNGSREPSPLCYVLDRKYNEADLSLLRLKDVDSIRARCLLKVCAELNFDFFLATIEKQESGTTENKDYYGSEEEEDKDDVEFHTLDEVSDESYRLPYLFTLEGHHLASDVSLDGGYPLQLDHPPFPYEPDDEDYEGSTRNSRPKATHWYTASALVIVPCEGTVPFLSAIEQADFSDLFDFFIVRYGSLRRKALRLNQLYEFLITNFESSCPEPLTEDQLLEVLQVSIHGSESGLLDIFLRKNTQAPPIEFFAWIRGEFDRSTISISHFEKLFRYAFSLQPTIYRRWEALCGVNEDLEEGEGKLRNIVSQVVNECLEACRQKRLHEEDGRSLFRIFYYHRGPDSLETAVLPVVEDLGRSTAFVLGFLHSFRLQGLKKDTQAIYERVALAALKKLDLASLTAAEIPQAGTGAANRDPKDVQGSEYVTYESMLKFISALMELKLQSHLDMFAKQVVSQANRVKAQEFDTLWIPLLHGLLLVIEKSRVPLPAPCWTQIYQNFFKAYLLNHVREQPVEPSLSRQALMPCCGDCKWVSEFLTDPAKRFDRFEIAKNQQQHILYRLSKAHFNYASSTECIGNKSILILSKTTPPQYDADANSWWTRRLHAESQFETFNPDMLRAVLQDQYDDTMSMKLIERSQPVTSNAYAMSVPSQHQQPLAIGSYEDQLAMINAEIARKASSSSIAPNHSTFPKPPVTLSTAVSSEPARSISRSTPKRSMLDVSRSISESARKQAAQNGSSPSTRRNAGASSPVGGGSSSSSTRSRPTQAIPNPIAGAKRKYIDVIDLTGDD